MCYMYYLHMYGDSMIVAECPGHHRSVLHVEEQDLHNHGHASDCQNHMSYYMLATWSKWTSHHVLQIVIVHRIMLVTVIWPLKHNYNLI